MKREKKLLKRHEKGEIGISKMAEILGWSLEKTHDYVMKNARRIMIS